MLVAAVTNSTYPYFRGLPMNLLVFNTTAGNFFFILPFGLPGCRFIGGSMGIC